MNLRNLYLKATSVSFSAKIFTAFGALLVIWLINQIAGKEGFGLIMLAFSFNYLLAAAIASFFQSIVLYHVSRTPEKQESFLTASLIYCAVFSIILAVLEYALSPRLTDLMNKPEALIYFQIFACMIPAFSLNALLTTFYRAKQNITTMVLFFEITPMIVRFAGLILVYAITASPLWVAVAYSASYIIPFVTLLIKTPLAFEKQAFVSFKFWDISYGVQSMLAQLVNKSLRNIVIVVLGFFVNAAAIAELTVAMRFAQFLQMPKLAIAQLQIPRMGALLKDHNHAAIQNEFNVLRNISLLLTLLGTLAATIIMPYILPIFGDYNAAYTLLILLAIASIIRAGFGAAGGYLNIAGYAGTALLTNSATLILLTLLLLILTPLYQTLGAAYALIIAALFSMMFMAALMLQKDKINTFQITPLIAMLISSFALVALTINQTTLLIAAGILIFSILLLAYSFISKQKLSILKHDT